MPALDVATAKHAQRRHIAHPDDFGCFLERDLASLGPFAVAVSRNLVAMAEIAYALLRLRMTISGRNADVIEQACNLTIRHQSS